MLKRLKYFVRVPLVEGMVKLEINRIQLSSVQTVEMYRSLKYILPIIYFSRIFCRKYYLIETQKSSPPPPSPPQSTSPPTCRCGVERSMKNRIVGGEEISVRLRNNSFPSFEFSNKFRKTSILGWSVLESLQNLGIVVEWCWREKLEVFVAGP